MTKEALDRLEKQLRLLADRGAGDLSFWTNTTFMLIERLREFSTPA